MTPRTGGERMAAGAAERSASSKGIGDIMNDPGAPANPVPAPMKKHRSYAKLAIALALLLVVVCVGGYLYLRARTAELGRDVAELKTRVVVAESKIELSDVTCRSELKYCTERESSCSKELEKVKRSMEEMVKAPPSAAAPPAGWLR